MKIAFYKGTHSGLSGVYNRGVRWWENGEYSHCEAIFSDGISASASYMDDGVRFKAIDYDPAKWDFIEIPAKFELVMRIWFEEHEGDSYDLLGNLHFVIGSVNDDKAKWFCSEALGAALGIDEPWRYGPNALASILRSLVLIEGFA